jgi:hypothetical protein
VKDSLVYIIILHNIFNLYIDFLFQIKSFRIWHDLGVALRFIFSKKVRRSWSNVLFVFIFLSYLNLIIFYLMIPTQTYLIRSFKWMILLCFLKKNTSLNNIALIDYIIILEWISSILNLWQETNINHHYKNIQWIHKP